MSNPPDEYGVYIEQRTVVGDSNAKAVLGCLTDVAVLYGDQFIFKQYLTYIQETVSGDHRCRGPPKDLFVTIFVATNKDYECTFTVVCQIRMKSISPPSIGNYNNVN